LFWRIGSGWNCTTTPSVSAIEARNTTIRAKTVQIKSENVTMLPKSVIQEAVCTGRRGREGERQEEPGKVDRARKRLKGQKQWLKQALSA